MFKKIAAITDLHVGLKSNSITHLTDCEDFIDWFIDVSKKNNCDTGIFMGDWTHNRNSINLATLSTSINLLEKLGKAFTQFFWFPGNHDLYYKDRRDVHSSIFGQYIPGITVVNEITTIDDVTMVPWLIGEEWHKIEKIKSRYMFGHFELPNFYMNAMIQMPNHGELQASHFRNQEFVFSGHFHKRQHQANISYIGNCFPHNFADAGDDDRGCMILEHGKDPEFHNWSNAPTYRKYMLSDVLTNTETLLRDKMHLRVELDVDISYEEANFIKEQLMPQYNIREMVLLPKKNMEDYSASDDAETSGFESIDNIVTSQITQLDSDVYNTKILLELYQNLHS